MPGSIQLAQARGFASAKAGRRVENFLSRRRRGRLRGGQCLKVSKFLFQKPYVTTQIISDMKTIAASEDHTV